MPLRLLRKLPEKRHFTAAVLIGIWLLGGCASQPKVYSNADSRVDFANYSTYAFLSELATDRASYESLETSYMKVAVSQELDRRGMAYQPEQPDLLVNFYILTKEKIQSRTVPTAGAYYDYRDPFYEPWGEYPAYETRITQYTEGTVQVDVVDARTRKLIWEGAVVGRVTDDVLKNLEREIDGAVTEIFSAFPIAP